MPTDLHERLADLATHTPPGSPPVDLWHRGVRRHRATQIGRGALVAALIAVIGLGGWAWHSTRPIEPADIHGRTHLPDRFFQPSPWLPAFDGPPGRLVAMGRYTRETLFHTDEAFFGVTATNGRYGRLVLPGLAGEARLSPDGRWIAFWISGPLSGTPNPAEGPPVAGVAVYDTVTGRVVRHEVDTVHGVAPQVLTWLPDDTLLVDYFQWSGGEGDPERLQAQADHEAAGAWDPAAGRYRKVRLPRHASLGEVSTVSGSPLIIPGDQNNMYRRWDPSDPARSWSFVWGDVDASQTSMVLDNAARRFAAVSGGPGGRAKTPNSIVAGDWPSPSTERRLGPEPILSYPVIPHSGHTFEVLGWLDHDHVGALRRDPIRGEGVTFRIDSVDVRTGRARTLSHGLPMSVLDMQLASDLLSAPPVHASPPPQPWDLRWTLGGLLAVLVTVALFSWMVVGERRT